ncbi:phage-like protein [Pectobacterium carotovorum subsp. carotovorum]|nr:phage-like protein [Pectobacterium carotovorum subsp. carotovorum]
MKEHPIIFNAEMVRAILDGRKTQTRRIIKPQPFDRSQYRRDHQIEIISGRAENGDEVDGLYAYTKSTGGTWDAKCPFGQPGDRLWVRETYSPDFANYYPNNRFWYASDNDRKSDIEVVDGVRGIYSPESDVHVPFRWRPSIHMPRYASRILLEITDVRVEKLKHILRDGIIAEGYPAERAIDGGDYDPFLWYRDLWESLYGDGSWQKNPWVWVIEFKQIK